MTKRDNKVLKMEKLLKYARNATGIALVILTLILLLNTYSILKLSKEVNSLVEKNKEAEKPIQVNVALLDCSSEQCSKLSQELTALKSNTRLNIEEEKSYTKETAAELISKYSVKKLPAIIVTSSKLDALSLQGYAKSGDALVLEAINAPYQDAVTGRIVGLVTSTTITEPSCKECPNLNIIVDNLDKAGVVISEKRSLNSEEAKDLLVSYNITRLPALILSSEFSNYELSGNWKLLGHIAEDNSYVLDLQEPPYYDLKKKEIFGLVSITTINDVSCAKCYNATEIHLPIIQRFGVYVKNEKSLDASSAEAAQLIKKYNIKSLPTILMSNEAADYGSLVNAWKDVGTVESDSVMVFRKNEVLGLTYKDLETGKVVESTPKANV